MPRASRSACFGVGGSHRAAGSHASCIGCTRPQAIRAADEALSNGRRRLRWAAIGFHPDRPQFGLCAVGIAFGRLRQLTRVLGADFRAHDPATEDNFALLRAHGWQLQPPLRRRATPLGLGDKSPSATPVIHAAARLFSCCVYAPLIHRRPETDRDRAVNTRLAGAHSHQLASNHKT